MRPRLPALSAALLLVALLPGARPGAAAKPGKHARAKAAEAPRPAAKAPPPAAKAPKEALMAAADEIVRQVAALRGLKPKGPVERGVLSRDEIGAKLKERIGKEYTPEEVRAESRVLKRLGLLPAERCLQHGRRADPSRLHLGGGDLLGVFRPLQVAARRGQPSPPVATSSAPRPAAVSADGRIQRARRTVTPPGSPSG